MSLDMSLDMTKFDITCEICDGAFDHSNPSLTYGSGWTHPECRERERTAEGRSRPGDKPLECPNCGGPIKITGVGPTSNLHESRCETCNIGYIGKTPEEAIRHLMNNASATVFERRTDRIAAKIGRMTSKDAAVITQIEALLDLSDKIEVLLSKAST